MSKPDNLAPETHNDEQDDEQSQAQTVASDRNARSDEASPTESKKGPNSSGIDGDSMQDTVDHMRDMESSGKIDMGAYRGEPNMDDDAGKYGKGHDAEFEDDDS